MSVEKIDTDKVLDNPAEGDSTGGEIEIDPFAETKRKNAETKRRLEEERLRSNAKVLREYLIK